MATAEYVTGSVGAIVIALIVYRLSGGEGSFFQDIIEAVLSHVSQIVVDLFRIPTMIG